MSIGISLQLFDGATPRANLTGIQALWWDVTEPKDASRPVGKSIIVTTDASGFIKLDLSNVTGLSLGQSGFLTLYKLDAGNHQDSLVFSGKVATSDVVGGIDMYYYDSGWTRPAGWLPLPAVADTEQKVVGLYAVVQDSNFIALNCAGAYTVDWGDGVTENFATGVSAYHIYDYADVELAGTEVTVNGSTYKQAIVTVTPQAANNLTSVNFNVRNFVTTVSYSTGWLDILVSSPSLTTLVVSSDIQQVGQAMLEQFRLIGNNAVTNFANMFYSCTALQSVPLLNTALGTNFGNMFFYCTALQSVPLLNTASGTNFDSMLYYCTALQSVPLLNTASGTNFRLMLGYCPALQSVPLLNTASGTNFELMFSDCTSLRSVPLLNTALGTNFGNMFYNCTALQSVPLLNTASGTSFNAMFSYCIRMQSVPLLDTSSGTNFANMFNSCTALQSVPLLNTALGTNFGNMFFSCSSLSKATLIGTKNTISYAGCKLSAAALNDIYTNLATVTAKTITVSSNWGTASDNPSIATAKGWTVTG